MARFGGVGDGKRGAGYAQAGGNLGGAPVKPEGGPSAGLAHDLDLQPAYAVADARSQGLGSGFLGGKAGGKALGGLALAQAIGLFRGGVDAVEKALP
jgi:predicted lipid-binding transport protein (Tim44 family)